MGGQFGEVAIGIAFCAAVGAAVALAPAPARAEGGYGEPEIHFPTKALPISNGQSASGQSAFGATGDRPRLTAPHQPPVISVTTTPAAPTATARPRSATPPEVPQVPQVPQVIVHTAPPRTLIPVTRLSGRAVVTPRNTRIGTLHEIAFAPEGGALYAVVAAIGAEGGHLVAVPARGLRLRATGALEVAVAEDVVADLPPVRPPRGAPTQSALLPDTGAGPYRLTPD